MIVYMYISGLLVFQWVQIVPHWWQIYIYIYDVLSLNKPKSNDYVNVIYIYGITWRLKTLQNILNGLSILTFVWSLISL